MRIPLINCVICAHRQEPDPAINSQPFLPAIADAVPAVPPPESVSNCQPGAGYKDEGEAALQKARAKISVGDLLGAYAAREEAVQLYEKLIEHEGYDSWSASDLKTTIAEVIHAHLSRANAPAHV